VAHHFTFFGQFGGVTRQCALCKELLVVNASSEDLQSRDANHLWSSAFVEHIKERHAAGRVPDDADNSATIRIVM
jgi:hypothetical protein